MKKRGLLLSVLLLICFNCSLAMASDSEPEPVIISSLEDWEQLKRSDEAAYAEKISKLDSELLSDVSEFNETYVSDSEKMRSNDVSEDGIFVEEFLQAYPQYEEQRSEQLVNDIKTSRDVDVVSAIRAFFKASNYDLALTLFNHSLLDNPADLYLDLTGHTGGMYDHIRHILSIDSFWLKLLEYSQFTTDDVTPRSFATGDLFWAIHKYDLDLNRPEYNLANFVIGDDYDFDPRTYDASFAGWSGCNEFRTTIVGQIKNGVIQ